MKIPQKISAKLQHRTQNNSLRLLSISQNHVDFSSNDYLGFAVSETIFQKVHQYLVETNLQLNGATGSRLLTGNHELYEEVEMQLSNFHNGEAGLLFNSGYDANIGFFSSVPQRGDVILFDEYIHASIRDGIGMSHAKSYKFKHNDLIDLEKKIEKAQQTLTENDVIYVVTESVFSMDGDSPDLHAIVKLCHNKQVYLVVDEAHAIGVFGKKGQGLLQELALEKKVFARIYTFGKALGCHGSVIIGSKELKNYLVNFSRSFIYTTALSPHAVATIKIAYDELIQTKAVAKLHQNIQAFQQATKELKFIEGNAAIHCCVIAGNQKVKHIAKTLQSKGFDVKAILSPTVPKGAERLRFCLHAYNTKDEIQNVVNLLKESFINYEE
ncbi:aminotransferase class I/II-fold pyridoxal phosphate-dependent enzyme [Kordia zhangzhouensis]|uniref:aminotransferase class I/II-fold pyridoxal phosphate-dependent enzyme n=1 Tax=Kordia zhangzhouensis TaxID=1620405 RepID=UPI0006290CF7|nr:aminotransferase class I/II-fold pyridoxal phosphate-dependent enzyme [Kordia zhangzhouensis]